VLRRGYRWVLIVAAAVYLLFAVSCFRLAVVDTFDKGVSVGEGLFTLLGATALAAAAFVPKHAALVALAGTIPLIGWFAATPWNSGPPFLVASLVVPAVSVAVIVCTERQRLI
jgi:hypothetical protein